MGPYHRIEGTLRSPSGLREQAQRLIEEAEAIEAAARPADVYVEGTVMRFTRPGQFRRLNYDFYDVGGAVRVQVFTGPLLYAAIKAGGEWFLTGKHTTGSTWDELIDFIGPENYHTIDTYGPSLVSKGQFESEDDYHFSQP